MLSPTALLSSVTASSGVTVYKGVHELCAEYLAIMSCRVASRLGLWCVYLRPVYVFWCRSDMRPNRHSYLPGAFLSIRETFSDCVLHEDAAGT